MLFYQVGSVLAASLVLSACQFTAAFRSSIFDLKLPTLPFGDKALHATRRDILEKASLSSLGTALASLSLSLKAEASGGATAGGAYLLSAKQRYNNRVSKGVEGFIGIKTSLQNGDIEAVRDFFASDEEGSWKDFSSAGYLLANAFRRTSSAAPDTLPSVKKWKAYTAQVEVMTKALQKKDSKGALVAYGDSLLALDGYLEKVELPTTK